MQTQTNIQCPKCKSRNVVKSIRNKYNNPNNVYGFAIDSCWLCNNCNYKL